MRKLLLPLFIIFSVSAFTQTETNSWPLNDTLFKTAPGTAFFWSGRTKDKGGADIALAIAKKNGGITLEGLIAERGLKMPEWNSNDSSTIRPWQEASAAYAKQVSGLVRAVVGNDDSFPCKGFF